MERPTKTLDFLQALRGIAALLVVVYHGARYISPYGEGLGWQLFGSGGAMGVYLFFVVSGFIMVYTTRGPEPSVFEFAVKRFSRIWPVYVSITLLYLLVTWGWGYWSDVENVTRFVGTITLLPLQIEGPKFIHYPALAVGWTLNYEAYFYAVFGASMLFKRWRWAAFFGWIALSLLVIPAAFAQSPLSTSPGNNYGFTWPIVALATNPMIWLFVAGVATGLLYQSRFKLDPFVAKVLVIFVTCLYAFQYASGMYTDRGVIKAGLASVMLVGVLSLASKSLTFKMPRLLVEVGNVSFSVYLLHPLVQEGMDRIFVATDNAYWAKGFSYLFFTTAMTVTLAFVSHRLLEQGLSNAARDWLMRPINNYRQIRTS